MAFKVFFGNPSGAAPPAAVNRIRFPAQTAAMGVGGMLGGNRVNMIQPIAIATSVVVLTQISNVPTVTG